MIDQTNTSSFGSVSGPSEHGATFIADRIFARVPMSLISKPDEIVARRTYYVAKAVNKSGESVRPSNVATAPIPLQ